MTSTTLLAAGGLSYAAAKTADEMDDEYRGNEEWMRLRAKARSQASAATALWALTAAGALTSGFVLYSLSGGRAEEENSAARLSLVGFAGGAGLSLSGVLD